MCSNLERKYMIEYIIVIMFRFLVLCFAMDCMLHSIKTKQK